MAVVIG
jgi:hypothetical protein